MRSVRREGSADSLFSASGSDDDATSSSKATVVVARQFRRGQTTPIPGLFYIPDLLDPEERQALWRGIAESDLLLGGKRDQVMLFTSPSSPFPAFIEGLVDGLPDKLRPHLPQEEMEVLFGEGKGRWQAIVNLYRPGDGIGAHVDLERYGDGIVGISLGCPVVMELTRVRDGGERVGVWVEEGSAVVLTGSARWDWQHGIPSRIEDLVLVEDEEEGGEGERVERRLRTRARVSVTLRRLVDDVVGSP